ncbi:MAG: MFS transporter, partial [Glutamicibacter ardleyensis]
MPIRSVPSWATTTVLALCGMVVALQQTLVVPLLPDFPVILGVSAEDSSWLVTATLLSAAIFTPVISRMADMYGKRKMLILALAVMTAGSLVAAIGGSFGSLIAGRAMQGF